MCLSVSIPGATDRTLEVHFVPLEKLTQKIKVTMSKTGKVSTLFQNLAMQWLKCHGVQLNLNDLHAVDVWNGEIYATHALDDDIDKIRETDVTYIFQLKPKEEVEEKDEDADEVTHDHCLEINEIKVPSGGDRFKLLLVDLTRLNGSQNWKAELDSYCVSRTATPMQFNPKRGTMEDRIRFLRRLVEFLENCVSTKPNPSIQDPLTWDDTEINPAIDGNDTRKTLEEVSSSEGFGLPNNSDNCVAKLLFIAKKFQNFLLEFDKDLQRRSDESGIVNILFPKKSNSSPYNRGQRINPISLRISGRTTVYQLREELARRLPLRYNASYLQKRVDFDDSQKHKSSEEENPNDAMNSNAAQIHTENGDTKMKSDPESEASKLLMMTRIPLTYERTSFSRFNNSSHLGRQLGILDRNEHVSEGPVPSASPNDDKEKERVLEVVGSGGYVRLNWPFGTIGESFDAAQHAEIEELEGQDDGTKNHNRPISVSDCIEKYCQMEQLEETEMWYCNKCKEHVRAWKQFHIYRSPPILIVHLKRFHYSASTHRRDKIDKLIDFPLEGLDLTEEVMHWTEEEKPIYDCYAVSNHYGGLGGGHYTAYAQSDDGVWCHFDDSRVSTGVEPTEVVSSAAYVLYYRRRDVVFETTGFGPPLPAIVQDHMDRSSPDSSAAVVESMDIDEERNDTFDDTQSSGYLVCQNSNELNDEGGDNDDETEYEYEDQDYDMPAQ